MRVVPADDVLSVIYRYGPPRSVRMLAAVLSDEAERREWETYVADMLWFNARKGLKNWQVRPYGETHNRRKAANDSRSGREIVQDLVRRRKARRKRGTK